MNNVRLPKEYFRAHRQARKAVLRGDLVTAMKWMELIERNLAIAERETELMYPRRKPSAPVSKRQQEAEYNPPAPQRRRQP